jgi:DNA-binding CsgD family transcriptional regulator
VLAPARETALERARDAWDIGAYERALQLVREARFERREDRVAAALLQARALLAVGRPDEIVPLIERMRKELKSGEDTVTAQTLLGAAMTRLNRRDQGEALLDTTAELAKKSAPRMQAEVAYYRALSRWASHRLDDAERIVESALPLATGAVRSRLRQLLGWIDVRRENYGPATHEFTAALDDLDKSGTPDVKGRAAILHALGWIAAETIDLRLGRLVRREYDTNRWSEDTPVERFQVLEFLAWLSLLEGNVARAWDERQLALTLTADTSYHAIALIHAAGTAEIVGDRFSQARYLDLCGALLLRGDQVALDVERRIGLLSFVAVASEAQGDAAKRVLALYDRSRPKRTEMLALEGDRRFEAFEQYARGKFAVSQGETQRGIAEMNNALNLWVRLNYRLRTAITANELRALTGDRRYAQIALDALRNAPDAWLRSSIERRTQGDDPLSQLTPAERRVLTELCKGKKSREIAAHFGRSFNTINNHTRGIFSAFGVRSRASLVAECARLGILDDIKTVR